MHQQLQRWIEEHLPEQLGDIMTLCAINSVEGSPEPGRPFGPGPAAALKAAAELCASYGFAVTDHDGYVATADLDPSLPRFLDILGHMDVVPAGDDWTVTEPYAPVIRNGRIYGRGTSDDKGPSLCALYAMRAIRECGIPLRRGVRFILGSNEETGSADIAHYYAREPEAEMTFSPDAEFPLINIEKGMFRGRLVRGARQPEGMRVLLDAGIATNAVPNKAVLQVSGADPDALDGACRAVADATGTEIRREDGTVTVIGVPAHASTPELGKNAAVAALMVLSLILPEGELLEAVRSLLRLFPWNVTDGAGLHIALRDDVSGPLTCTMDILRIDVNGVSAVFDSRCPVCAGEENCVRAAVAAAAAEGYRLETRGLVPPHVVSGDSPLVTALLEAYREVSGLDAYCMAIGGGTYVHALKNGVAFGAILPGVDTHMHGADEFMDIDNIRLATEIYAEAILKLCGGND